MDVFDATLYNMHLLLGHDTTARFIGEDPGDKSRCHLCHPELCTDECAPAHRRKGNNV